MALMLAALWLAGLAALGILGAVALASTALGSPGTALMAGAAAAGLGACAIVAFRARWGGPFAVAVAFVLGLIGLILLLAPAVARILPWTGGLYGINLDGLEGLFVVWAILAPPAVLLIIGSVRRWCAMGGESAGRQARRAGVVAVAIAVPIVALIAVDIAAPLCPRGRACIPAAGISLVLPDGWSRRIADADQLFEASAGDVARITIVDGREILGSVASLADVERAAREQFGQNAIGFTHSNLSSDRIGLPIGPAVRVSWVSRPWFYQVDQGNTTEWFFLDGRLLVIMYQAAPPGAASDDFRLVRESLRALDGRDPRGGTARLRALVDCRAAGAMPAGGGQPVWAAIGFRRA
jgi:hypothetical protein